MSSLALTRRAARTDVGARWESRLIRAAHPVVARVVDVAVARRPVVRMPGVGLLVAMAADRLARIAGLSATAGWVVGAGLVGYGALLYVLAAAPRIRTVGIAVLAGNVAFAVVTVIAIGVGWLALTGTGDELVLGFVSATAVLAWLQYRGVRRLA